MADENKIPLTKKNKREMSPFIGHELLYDYLSNTLDEARKTAVEDHIKYSRDAQLDLEKIQLGDNYLKALSETKVSAPILESISKPSNYLNTLLHKLQVDKWPQGVKWGLEALVVITGIVVVLSVLPWQKAITVLSDLGSNQVTLAEIGKKTETIEKESEPEFVDEVKPAATVAESNTAAANTPVEKAPPVLVPGSAATPTAPTVSTTTATPPKAPPVAPAPVKTIPVEVAAEDKTPTPAVATGYLYRGTIALTNIEAAGPKISAKVIELGGRKAGSVELGWAKTPGSMYYHLTIPEAKYAEMLTYLSTYGTPKFVKEKHSRVMPDGIIRLIFTVDELQQ